MSNIVIMFDGEIATMQPRKESIFCRTHKYGATSSRDPERTLQFESNYPVS